MRHKGGLFGLDFRFGPEAPFSKVVAIVRGLEKTKLMDAIGARLSKAYKSATGLCTESERLRCCAAIRISGAAAPFRILWTPVIAGVGPFLEIVVEESLEVPEAVKSAKTNP